MDKQIVLVTGSTDGIGMATARTLAERGAHVIVHGRTADKVERAISQLAEGCEGIVADFASLSAVSDMADEISARFDRLHALVNNAGTYEPRRRVTQDGLELTFQVNHLAPFMLTTRLLPLLQQSAPSRVVTVTSTAHAKVQVDFDDLQHQREYDAYRAYAEAKLENVVIAYALARRLEGTGTTSNCVEPASTQTKMLAAVHPEREGQPADVAASEIADAVLAEEFSAMNGQYLSHGSPKESSEASRDEGLQERLWRVSEQLIATGLHVMR